MWAEEERKWTKQGHPKEPLLSRTVGRCDVMVWGVVGLSGGDKVMRFFSTLDFSTLQLGFSTLDLQHF